MAATQQVVWTAIPNGIRVDGSSADKLRIAVHASLRANGDGLTLNSYPAFLHWATQAAVVGFDLTLNLPGAQTKPTTRVSAAPVTVIWDSLFASNMKVHDRTQARDYANHRVISYPVRHIHDYLRDMHVNAAVSSGEDFVGLLEWFENYTGDLGYGHDNQKDLQRLLLNLDSERGQDVNGKPKRYNDFPAGDHQKAFAALREFHAPRQISPDDEASQQPIELPVFDFHQALSLIGEHAPMMRLLGLAFDLEVAVSDFTGITAGGADGTISVTPTTFAPSGSFSSVLPKTRVRVSSTEFYARTNNPAYDRGHLVLGGNTPSYDVLRVDVDGAGLKTAHTADSTALSQSVGKAPNAKKQNNAPDAPQAFSLPPMRSAGFQVVRDDQAPRFVERIDRSKTLTDNLPSLPELDAADITKGYVLDVFDGGRWCTTAARSGSYVFPNAGGYPPVTVEDQAPFDSVPTGSTDPNAAEEFNLQPSLIRWDGWSLAGARPGKPLADDGTPMSSPGSSSQIPVEINLKAKPGSLPLLRFGRTYRLRLRTVSIAGTGVSLEEGANSGQQVSPPQAYLRHDPVASPDVHTRDQAVPGETIRTLVIRGNFDTEASDFSERTIAPPRVAMQLAETHGMFDVGGVPAKAKYTQIAGREAKHFDKDLPIDVQAPVPYLPDVLARGAALRGGVGALNGKTTSMGFDPAGGGAWPDLRPFQLSLRPAAAAGFDAKPAERVLVAGLTKGDEATIKLSCHLTQNDLPLLGLFEWITQKGQNTGALISKLVSGSLWSFTPYQTVKLVYAVRQPLIAPSFGGGAGRALGATSADISGGMNFSRKSTSRLDVQAQWTEVIDDVLKAAPEERPFAAKAFEVPIPAAEPAQGAGGVLGTPGEQNAFSFKRQHEFGDTRHRVVEYKVLGTSKFAEHFKGHVELPTVGVVNQPKLISAEGFDVRSVVVKQNGAVKGADTYEAHADGTITFKGGPFNANMTGVTVDFTPNVTRLTEGAGAKISVPSSARPAAPEVVDVVPIFQWTNEVKSKSIKSAKSASAFRLFLDRPWYSSGDGELLGVILFRDPAPLTTLDESVQRYVTEWGADPVFKGNVLPNFHPKVNNFAKRVKEASGLVLDEVPASRLKVDVAGHEVKYDAERKLWYCDVVVNTGVAYTPFVRLTVARYQPNSIAGVELSRTVQLDIMQVAPGRTITVTRTGTGANTIQKVAMTGYDYTDGPESTPPKANYLTSPHGLSRAQVVVERRNTSYKADQLMGWTEHKTYEMKRGLPKNFVYTWATSQPITLPKGPVRLVVRQFEWVASDGNRYNRTGNGFRLVHQDIINPRATPAGTIKTG